MLESAEDAKDSWSREPSSLQRRAFFFSVQQRPEAEGQYLEVDPVNEEEEEENVVVVNDVCNSVSDERKRTR